MSRLLCYPLLLMLLMLLVAGVGADEPNPVPLRGLREVSHASVELRGGFWGPRLKTHVEVTIPHALSALEGDGHVTNFDKAAGRFDGPLKGHHAFDSDLHKALEGAMYSLRHNDDDARLRRRVDGILDRILAAQEKDGFLISYFDEGFGDPYLLPNDSAYCESCAAIAHVLWQHRMNLLKAEAKYADMLELSLYNGVLSGIAISGDRFCYQNPLASGGSQRPSWIGLACCPTNLARIIPQPVPFLSSRTPRETGRPQRIDFNCVPSAVFQSLAV